MRAPDEQANLIGDANAQEPLIKKRCLAASPLRLDIGFGHGEFIANMAATTPDEILGAGAHRPARHQNRP